MRPETGKHFIDTRHPGITYSVDTWRLNFQTFQARVRVFNGAGLGTLEH